jgi:hypothetical protein
MKLYRTLFTVVVGWSTASAAASSSYSYSNARLPLSLQKVVADLQQQQQQPSNAEGEEEQSTSRPRFLSLTTASLVTSQSVTRREKKSLLQALLVGGGGGGDGESDDDDDDDDDDAFVLSDSGTTAIGTRNGLILALVPESNGVAVLDGATIVASCGGNVLYYPSAVDVQRGEGLFTTLAPVMEQIVSATAAAATSGSSSSSSNKPNTPRLVVVVPDDDGDDAVVSVEMCQIQLEKAAETVLSSHLVVTNKQQQPLSLLQDVFVGGVQYISKRQLLATGGDLEVLAALGGGGGGSGDAADAIASRLQQATATAASTLSSPSSMTGNNLASARILGPRSRIVLQECLESVLLQTVADDAVDSNVPYKSKLTLDFGNLVRVSLQQGLKKLDDETAIASPTVQSCTVTKQIRHNFIGQFHQAIDGELQEQLSLLQAACFDDFKRGLSKLILSPQLASDMAAVGNTAIASFAKQAKRIVHGATSKSLADQVYTTARQEFARTIQQTCANRLLTARANGKFRPLPRKGVTVGLHWLLPKPFGNDYRQEPWMVHATDNMVYVPQDRSNSNNKVQNVNPNDVQSGADWKNKIVPSPIGNDMIYVQ